MAALVLDLTRLLPGPLAAKILGSLGFRVLRLTRPQGDLAQSAAPELYDWLNSDKSTREVDLKSDVGREALLALARKASILLESDLPGVMERLGVGYETLRKENPRLVYVRVGGYKSPSERPLPGHDLTYLAASGMLPGMGALWKRAQMADLCGGFWAAIAALDGLQKGGGFYEVHLSEAFGAVGYPQPEFLNGSVVCYNVYECSEGHIALAALESSGWQRFCELACHPEWIPNGFSSAVGANPVYREICEVFRSRTAPDWDEWATTNRLSLRAVQQNPSVFRMPPWKSEP